jgi:hypothetical protein
LGLGPRTALIVVELLVEAHGRAFRRLSEALGFGVEGLAVAARWARWCGVVEAGLPTRLERLDTAFAFARHTTGPKVDDLLTALEAQLQRAQAASATQEVAQ